MTKTQEIVEYVEDNFGSLSIREREKLTEFVDEVLTPEPVNVVVENFIRDLRAATHTPQPDWGVSKPKVVNDANLTAELLDIMKPNKI